MIHEKINDPILQKSQNLKFRKKSFAQNKDYLEELEQFFNNEISPLPFLEIFLKNISKDMSNNQLKELSLLFPYEIFVDYTFSNISSEIFKICFRILANLIYQHNKKHNIFFNENFIDKILNILL